MSKDSFTIRLPLQILTLSVTSNKKNIIHRMLHIQSWTNYKSKAIKLEHRVKHQLHYGAPSNHLVARQFVGGHGCSGFKPAG